LFLVGTDVIAAGARARLAARLDVVAWMDRNAEALFVSAITVAEIEVGVARARRLGAGRKADDLSWWLEALLHLYSHRVLPFDVPAARFAGALADQARDEGLDCGFSDLAIAATAHVNGLTLLTRNLGDFSLLPVAAIDPFAQLPSD
jgi:predicted nucleic acid-binding protein